MNVGIIFHLCNFSKFSHRSSWSPSRGLIFWAGMKDERDIYLVGGGLGHWTAFKWCKETLSSSFPTSALVLTLKNLPREAEIQALSQAAFWGGFFFLNMLEIYQGSESSVISHHGGTERRVHGWPGQWAFVAVPPPGQEITVFENLCLSGDSGEERAHGPSLMDGAQTFLVKLRQPTSFFFKRRRNVKWSCREISFSVWCFMEA